MEDREREQKRERGLGLGIIKRITGKISLYPHTTYSPQNVPFSLDFFLFLGMKVTLREREKEKVVEEDFALYKR